MRLPKGTPFSQTSEAIPTNAGNGSKPDQSRIADPTQSTSGSVPKSRRRPSERRSKFLSQQASWHQAPTPEQAIDAVFDSLAEELNLDFAYARVERGDPRSASEIVRTALGFDLGLPADEFVKTLRPSLSEVPRHWSGVLIRQLGGREISLVAIPLGVEGNLGRIFFGSARPDFPQQTDELFLRLAASRVSVEIQHELLQVQRQETWPGLDLPSQQGETRTEISDGPQGKPLSEPRSSDDSLPVSGNLLQRPKIERLPGLNASDASSAGNSSSKLWDDYAGMSPAEVQWWNWISVIHPDDISVLMDRWKDCLTNGGPQSAEIRMRSFEGIYRSFRFSSEPVEQTSSIHLTRDKETNTVESYRGSIEELKLIKARHLFTVESSDEALLSLDNKGTIIVASPATRRMFGYPADDLAGKPVTRLFPEFTRIFGSEGPGDKQEADPGDPNWRKVEMTGLRITGESTQVDVSFRRSSADDGLAGTVLVRLITDDSQANRTAQVHENEFRLMIDMIPGEVCTFTSKFEVEFANQPFLDFFGKTIEELRHWETIGIVHPDDVESSLAYSRHIAALGEPFDAISRRRRHDGVFRWVRMQGRPLRDAHGKIVRWYMLQTDVDDRKRAEEALAASERKLSLIINTMPVLAWSTQPDGSADFFNQTWLDYTGLSSDEAHGWGWRDLVHPDDASRLIDYWQNLIREGGKGEIEARFRRFDGEFRWFLFRASPLLDESGRVVKWYGTNTDIHDRKLAEERVRLSEAFLADAQRVAHVGSFSWKVPADEIEWSAELYRMFEFEPGTPITFALIGSRIHPEDLPLMYEKMGKGQEGISNIEYVERLLMPDGSVKYLHLTAYLTRDDDDTLRYIGTVQDITHRKTAEDALAEARAELAEVARFSSMGMLTASIAHEVNQPLSGIITNASTCLRMLSMAPPDVEGAIETARRTIRDGNRAADVISRLRALFKRKRTTAEKVDITEAIREVIAISLSDIQRNRVIIQEDLAPDLPPIKGDRVQLQQVILNLLRNACEAMLTIQDRPRLIIIRTEYDAEGVRLSMEDSGIGFKEELEDRLFASFFTTKQDGMGIGLAVSRSIIQAHGGGMWAKPNRGPGATFGFWIPRSPELEGLNRR